MIHTTQLKEGTGTMKRTRQQAEREWNEHCERLQWQYNILAQQLISDGWEQHNKGQRFVEYFAKGDEAIVIRRKLGQSNWYTTQKDF